MRIIILITCLLLFFSLDAQKTITISAGQTSVTQETKLTLTDNDTARLYVTDYGAVGDGVTDNLAAFEAAIAASPDFLNAGGFANGGNIYIPSGEYAFSAPLVINKSIHLIGEGTWSTPNVILKFPQDSNGIDVTMVDLVKPTQVKISNIRIEQVSGGTAGDGVTINYPVHLDQCRILYFNNGVRISAGAGGDVGNANYSKITYCQITHNGNDGIYTEGADANALLIMGCDISSNTGQGVHHTSLFNSTYLANHFASNSGNAFYDPTGSSQLIGCYFELAGGQVYTNGMIVGGTLPVVPLAADSTPNVHYLSGTGRYYHQFSVQGDGGNLVTVGDNDVTDAIEVLSFFGNGNTEFWYLDTVDQRVAIPAFETTTSDVYFATGFNVHGYGTPNPTYIGSTSSGFLPDATNYEIGDRFIYNNPVAGGAEGVVVVDSSGVNVLREFGSISNNP